MKTIKSILIGIAAFVIIYLMFSFGNADFNIVNWDISARALCAFAGFVLGCAASGIYAHYNE